MTAVFLHFLNMSITAGWIVLAVLLLRLCLKRAPRWITCLLWGLVALRLVLPFSIESALSLIPSAQTVPSDIVSTDTPSIDSGVTIIDRPVNDLLQTVVPSQPVTPPADTPSVTPVEPTVPLMERITQVAAWVWVGGIALMLVYELVSVWRLRRRVFDAIRLRDNLWQTDRIDSPFILGVFRPRIYLPYGLDEDTTAQVLAHEQSHLRRRDHWVKPFAFTLLAVYWFNPLLWVAYILLCRDIEIACDERVIRDLSATERQQYATALLNCGVERRSIAACPLAFGEVGLKQRIKSALHYRKPLLWVIIASLLVCSVAAVCLLTVPGERAIEVLNSQEVEPDQSRNYCSNDTDGSITDSGLAWLWEHAENRKDRKDATSMPLTIVDSLDELNELVEALNAPQQADIGYWMNFEKYDDTYFEENTLVWVFIPGDDNGRYEYTVSLEETNKGLRYAAYLTRLATSTFYGGAPSRCQNLLLFEVDRDTVKQTDRFMTRYEWTDVDTPSEEDGHYMSVGSADVDGDGEPEDISLFIESSTDNYLSYSIVVRRADGTPLLNEVYDGYGSFQCYLVPQEDGPARLLLISGHMGNESDCERYCVLSLEDGVRTMIDYSWDGQVFSGYALRLDLMAFYVQSLSGWLEDAQLVFESAMGEVYHGDTIGSATYEPLSWLDAYQQSEDDTLQDTMENILADYAVETTPVGEIDFDGDGRQETLSAVSYWSGSTDRYCLVVRDTEEKIVTCFDVYSYFTSIDDYENSENVYVYKITDSAGRESLVRLEVQKDGDCLIYDLTESGSHYSHSMPQEEWRSSLQGKTCEALFHIWNRELTLIDTQAITYRPSFFSATYRLEVEVETDPFGMERVRSLSLWNKRRTKCVQTFSFADFGYDEYDYTVVTDQPIYLRDVTFDGREELLIPVAYSARYQDFGVFLWDKKNKQLDWLTTTLRNPAVDEKHKVIRTRTSGDGISSYSAWAYNADTQDFACTHSLYFEENSGATGDGDAMRLVVTEEGKTTELFVPGERYGLDKTDPQVAPYYEDGSFWDLDSDRWGEVFYQLADEKSDNYETYVLSYRPSFFSRTYRLEIEVETNSLEVERIRTLSLWNKRRTKCVQTIHLSDIEPQVGLTPEWRLYTEQPVYMLDITFDGCDDMIVPAASAYGIEFAMFRWDKAEKQLKWLPTPLRNPVVDEKNKVIRTHYAGDSVRSYSVWKYDADAQDFVCTHSLYTEINDQYTGDADRMRLVVTKNEERTEFLVPGDEYFALDKTDPQVAPYYEDGSFWDLDSERWTAVFYRLAEKKSEGSDKLNPDYPVLLEKGENYHLYATEDQLEYWYCVWDDSGEVLDSGNKDYRGACSFAEESGLLILTHSGGGSSVQPSKRYYDVRGQYASGANRVSEDFGPVVAHKQDRVAYFDEDDSGQIVLRVKNLFDRSEQPVEIYRDYSTMVFRTACSGSFSTNGKALTFTYYSSPDDDAVTETVILNGEQRSYLSPDPTKDTAYNNAIAVYNDFLSGQISAVDKTGETLSLHVTDIVSDIYTGKKGPSRYALADLTGDGVPELLTESYYWTLDIFSVQAGELVRMFYKNPSSTWKVLSNGAVWADKTGAGSMYTYTVFDRSGTAQSVSFGDPGEGSSLSCYFEDEDVTREQYEALTAEYFYQSELEALMLWYDYDERLPKNQYISLLNSEYSDGDAWYALYDMDRDGTEELIVQKWPKLYVYTLDEGELKLLVEDEFVGGTSRFLLTLDRDYPGFVYFTVGGGKDRYYYLSLDKVEDNKFVRTPLWTDNYGEYQEGEPGRITELTENKQLIELSRKAYQNDWDVIFTSLNGEREPDRSHVAVPEAYTAVLQDYKELLDFRFSENFNEDFNNGIMVELNPKMQQDLEKDIPGDFYYMYVEMDEAKDCDSPDDYGYVLKDINDDGVQELFWVGKCHTILAVFTIMNGQAELLDAFWPRYMARMTEDGYLYTQGSGGAAYTQFDIYKLLPNSSVLERRIGFAQDGEDVYLEWVEDKQVTITQERFEKLQQQHPFEHSVEWLCLPIIAL